MLTVHAALKKQVIAPATAPVVAVTLSNGGSAPIALAGVATPAGPFPQCVRVTLDRITRTDCSPVAVTEPESGGDSIAIEPHASVLHQLDLGLLLPGGGLDHGAYVVGIELDMPPGPDREDVGAPLQPASVLTSAELYVADVRERFEIRKGRTVRLSSGPTVRFVGHGHKRVRAGQQSPLIIELAIQWRPSQQPVREIFRAFPGEEILLVRRSHVLELVEYEYDERMTLLDYGAFLTNTREDG